MEKLLKQIFLLAGLISLAFGAYAYLTERPTAVVGALASRLDDEVSKVYAAMDARRLERDASMEKLEARLNARVDHAAKQVLDRLEKIDDRLYDMQKAQKERAVLSNGEVYSEDI